MLQSCFDNLDIPLTEIYCKCVLVSSWNLSVLKRSWYSCETCPMNSQPDLHYGSSSRRCSMMSSQITVCSLDCILECRLLQPQVGRRLTVASFHRSLPPILYSSTHPSAHPLSLPFPPTHVSLQRAVAVWWHHGGWMCGCRGDRECCLRTPGWTRK